MQSTIGREKGLQTSENKSGAALAWQQTDFEYFRRKHSKFFGKAAYLHGRSHSVLFSKEEERYCGIWELALVVLLSRSKKKYYILVVNIPARISAHMYQKEQQHEGPL